MTTHNVAFEPDDFRHIAADIVDVVVLPPDETGFAIGDVLVFHEFDPEQNRYTGTLPVKANITGLKCYGQDDPLIRIGHFAVEFRLTGSIKLKRSFRVIKYPEDLSFDDLEDAFG
jgi:hypothetical protein